MTITLDRPAVSTADAPTSRQQRCPHGLSWCAGDPSNHDPEYMYDGEPIYHDSPAVDVPMTGGSNRNGGDGFTVSLERQDIVGEKPGRTFVYLSLLRAGMPAPTGGYATLEEADRIARTILDHVTTVRGMRRASDLRIGDRISVEQVTHTVTGVTLDRATGMLNVYTDRGGATVAAQFKPSEMVPLRAETARAAGVTRLGAEALAALDRLSASQRIAMRLRYVDGHTLAEAASVMGVRPENVKAYTRKAKTQLREWGVLEAPTSGGAA